MYQFDDENREILIVFHIWRRGAEQPVLFFSHRQELDIKLKKLTFCLEWYVLLM